MVYILIYIFINLKYKQLRLYINLYIMKQHVFLLRNHDLYSILPEACNFIKKEFWHRCFPVNFAKFLRTTLLQNTSEGLVLY